MKQVISACLITAVLAVAALPATATSDSNGEHWRQHREQILNK